MFYSLHRRNASTYQFVFENKSNEWRRKTTDWAIYIPDPPKKTRQSSIASQVPACLPAILIRFTEGITTCFALLGLGNFGWNENPFLITCPGSIDSQYERTSEQEE